MLNNTGEINKRWYPGYHFAVPAGWMNDPNGFVYWNGYYHLFYQYNPYEPKWGPMHWGHCRTKDFVTWEHLPIALTPDQDYEKGLGCFSGTALAQDEKLYLMYTGACTTGEGVLQQQCLAVSADGMYFEKLNNAPVITKDAVPEGYIQAEFRDPKLFVRNGRFYCLVGGRNTYGEIFLYESIDMEHWEYKGTVVNEYFKVDGVLECPDIVRLGDKDVLICSPQNLPQEGYSYQNIMSSVYMVGALNLDTGRFETDYMGEIDSGFDFYAPQTLITPDNRIIMTAWMNLWGRSYPTAEDGWVGAFIFPRELTFQNGRLYQNPVRELQQYRINPVCYENILVEGKISLEGISGNRVELNLAVDLQDSDVFGINLFSGVKHATRLYYEKKTNCLILDRTNSGKKIKENPIEQPEGIRRMKLDAGNDKLTLQLLLDKCSVEVFAQDGVGVMTATVYPDMNDVGIEFFAIGGKALICNLQKYEIGGFEHENE